MSESLGEQEMLWEHEPLASVCTAFQVLSNFYKCFYNSIETKRTCFVLLFRKHHDEKKKKNLLTVNSLCSRHHYVNSTTFTSYL